LYDIIDDAEKYEMCMIIFLQSALFLKKAMNITVFLAKMNRKPTWNANWKLPANGFAEMENEILKSYKILSSFKYLEELVTNINIPEEVRDEIPE
jgi:hypothetical protein